MRKSRFLLVLLASITIAPQANAGPPKPWVWGWWPSHWQGLDFKPYLGDQQIKNRSLWDGDTWTPELWIADAGGDPKRIMHDFYANGIIQDQFKNGDDVPVLQVGETFLRLSGSDRIRILRFVDHVFEITKQPEGMFFVQLGDEDDLPLGIWDKRGFQQY
jgi:hypothetical protein